MEVLDLFEMLKEKFPTCFFTHKGKLIKIHLESYIDGLPAFQFTQFKYPYRLGLHYTLADLLDEHKFFSDFDKQGEVIIRKE